MIVIGVDVHKHSLTAVAVDELGRQLDAVDGVGEEALIGWGRRLGRSRLWALEDCRHVTRSLERKLQLQRTRTHPGQVRCDRRARDRAGRFA
jgi:transposase